MDRRSQSLFLVPLVGAPAWRPDLSVVLYRVIAGADLNSPDLRRHGLALPVRVRHQIRQIEDITGSSGDFAIKVGPNDSFRRARLLGDTGFARRAHVRPARFLEHFFGTRTLIAILRVHRAHP
jgi:hypothetical protein